MVQKSAKDGFRVVTKEIALLIGRLAHIGLASSAITETVTGEGPLSYLGFETGVPLPDGDPVVLAFMSFLLLASLDVGNSKLVKE